MKNKFTLMLTIIIVLCVYESFTKGIMSIFLVPLSVVLLPLYAYLTSVAHRRYEETHALTTKILSFLLTLSILASYILMAGGGDTEKILLFGVYPTDIHNVLYKATDPIAYASFWYVMPALFAVMILWLVLTRHRGTFTYGQKHK